MPTGINLQSKESGGSSVRPETEAQIIVEKENEVYGGEDSIVEAASNPPEIPFPTLVGGTKKRYSYGKKKVKLANVKFAEEIKIHSMRSIDFRILCYFLNITDIKDVKNYPYQEVPLVTLTVMQCLMSFMESENYTFAGELNWDSHGNYIPTEKTAWEVGGKNISFTDTGFLYFEKNNEDNKNKNVVFFLHTNLSHSTSSMVCYTKSENFSKKMMNSLISYSKSHNCLRGGKFKDIMLYMGEFSSMKIRPEYTWDNFYYTDGIKNLFELEVFGFLKEVKKYNKYGINKRGILLTGRPGTGKTTLGYILCNLAEDATVIWITPESIAENSGNTLNSIKQLYKLADFVSPCIVILEDLDLFALDRERAVGNVQLGSLMNILDGVNTILNAVTIGTTNRLDCIEDALRNRPGRFDRIIEVPALNKDLRHKMFSNRLKEWKVTKEILDYIVEKTDEWTGAENQEFINTLNLHFIGKKKNSREINKKVVDEIIQTMKNFGVGEHSGSNFGFTASKEKK